MKKVLFGIALILFAVILLLSGMAASHKVT